MSPDAPPPPALEAPAPPAPVPATSPGQEALDRAVEALSRGAYEEALQIAIPGVSQHPNLAPSFQAVADVAADQLARRREPAPVPPATVYGAYPPPPYGYPYRRSRLTGGVELGLPTGFRIEWKIAREAVDAWGFRLGGNLCLYGGSVYGAFELSTFVDFNLAESWQLEAVAGLSAPYPGVIIGAAAQYDPDEPYFVNLGARVGPGAITPDLTVGWVW